MLRVPHHWVWDSWYVDDGSRFHAFFLKAPMSLVDPELRHEHARVGHATSTDLVNWELLPDALAPSPGPAFDDAAIWTGSMVGPVDGLWHFLYTGISTSDGTRRQRIGHATSTDLTQWERTGESPVCNADPRWYSTIAQGGDLIEHWRDPWIIREGDHWRILITAATTADPVIGSGCWATAVSDDLDHWTVEPPALTETRMFHLEVPQTIEIDGQWVGVFCLTGNDVRRSDLPRQTGTWTMPCDGPAGPFHLERSEPINVPGNYAGRIVEQRDGTPVLMAFVDIDADGDFGGCIGDPVPLARTDRGTLQPNVADPQSTFLGGSDA